MHTSTWPAPLALRLALAFVAVALLPVILVPVLSVLFTERDVTALVQERHAETAADMAQDATESYLAEGRSWNARNLQSALDMESDTGAHVAVLDAHGHAVTSTLTAADHRTPGALRRPVVLDGQRVGTVMIVFTGEPTGLAAEAGQLRSSLVTVTLSAAGLAAVLALLAAALMSRLITQPVLRLIRTARARGRGERGARVGDVSGAPAELRELAAAFDQMADTLNAQEQLLRDLVADIAHELRTPVAVLQANTEALLDGLVEHTPEQTASLHEEALRLSRLVGDLQRLAAAEVAAVQLSTAPCDLADVAEDAAQEWEASFAAAGVGFSRHLDAAPVLGDQGRLHQVVTNLLSNALKFTPSGGQVRMRLCAAGGHARLAVADTGPGVSQQEQPHVFDRLWRGARSAGTAGSGIGLAVAAELARAHHGIIELASEPGQGARFTLVLPLASQAADPPAALASLQDAGPGSRTPQRRRC